MHVCLRRGSDSLGGEAGKNKKMHFLKSDKNLGKVCEYTYTKDELNVYFTLQVHCQS